MEHTQIEARVCTTVQCFTNKHAIRCYNIPPLLVVLLVLLLVAAANIKSVATNPVVRLAAGTVVRLAAGIAADDLAEFLLTSPEHGCNLPGPQAGPRRQDAPKTVIVRILERMKQFLGKVLINRSIDRIIDRSTGIDRSIDRS